MSKEETMVERVAFVIATFADRFGHEGEEVGPAKMVEWDDYGPREKDQCRAAALAVIDTLMEPILEAAYLGAPHQSDAEVGGGFEGKSVQYIFSYAYSTARNDATEAIRAMLSKAKEGTGE